MKVAEMVFSHLGMRVAVSSPEASDLQWLSESMTPAFSVDADVTSAAVRIHVVVDPKRHQRLLSAGPAEAGELVPFFGFDGHSAEFQRCAGVDNCVQDSELRLFYTLAGAVAGPPDSPNPPAPIIEIIAQQWRASIRVALLRMLRELASQRLPARQCRQMHAAALENDAHGLLICGPRRAGKTSLLLHLLRARRTRYLANDRALLHLGAADDPWLSGMPTVVSIRERTVRLLPSLDLDGMHHWLARMTLAEARALAAPSDLEQRPASPQALSLSPAHLLDWLAVESADSAPLGGVFFPEVDESIQGIRLARLGSEDIHARLADSMMPPRATELTDWLDGLAATGGMLDDVRWPKVPGYRCILGRNAFEDAASADRLLAQLSADREAANAGRSQAPRKD